MIRLASLVSRAPAIRATALLAGPTATTASAATGATNRSVLLTQTRWYSRTSPSLEDEGAAVATKPDKKQLKDISQEYNRRRAVYKKNVKQLRKDYKAEYERHKEEDEAARQAEKAQSTRKRLERQRAKNIRSAQNAMRQEELRKQTDMAFQYHLQAEQKKREANKELFMKARQLVIDEIEQEAPLWMTTAEEVDAALTDEAEQLLWSRPGGYVGVPEPSLDSKFWQYETHTWRNEKTYKTQAETLLEEMEDKAYDEANIDSDFWTSERLTEQEALEQKAKLRAMVRSQGRKSLLKRQQQYLAELSETDESEVPKPDPVPTLRVLADVEAQEREGSSLLMKNPKQFFVFDRAMTQSSATTTGGAEEYAGPGLGAPVELRDPLRANSPQGRVFPTAVGKLPKPDTRTEKEKKREAREQQLMEAAKAQSAEADLDMEDEDFVGESLDYAKLDNWDPDDEEWVKGLDPDLDKDIINAPKETRYMESDIEWVIEELEKKTERLQTNLNSKYTSLKEELLRKAESEELEINPEASEMDNEDVESLEAAGVDPAKFEEVLSSLSRKQLVALFSLGLEVPGKDQASKSGIDGDEVDVSSRTDKLATDLDTIPDLTEEQKAAILEMESALQTLEARNSEDA